jgi:hypothetical protein
MDELDPREVEEAFRHLWRVGPVGEDWAAQAALFTEDAVYVDHYYGRKTPAEFLTWCTQLMNEEFPEIYTVYEWHVVERTLGVDVVVDRHGGRLRTARLIARP